jgi:integrase
LYNEKEVLHLLVQNLFLFYKGIILLFAYTYRSRNMEREYQQLIGLECKVIIDGYTEFVFLNRDGGTFYQGSLNKTIRRIIRDCNDEVLQKNEENPVLLPHFSCHSLRHTFTTRMCEAGVNIKVIQDTLGHADISTTLNIYADVTRELKKEEFAGLDSYFQDMKISQSA